MPVSIEEGLVAFLKLDAALLILIPDGSSIRLYPLEATQGKVMPHATYQVIDTVEEHSLLSDVDFPVARLQLDFFADGPGGQAAARALAYAVKNSRGGNSSGYRLKEFRGSLGGVDVRGCRLESENMISEIPQAGSGLPVRRITQDYMVSYVEQ